MAYPEGLAQMPAASIWAVMFFFMLFTIGIGSQVRQSLFDLSLFRVRILIYALFLTYSFAI